jgi:biotin carboxyl carrier protein
VKYYTRIGPTEYEVEINDKQVLLNGVPVDVDIVRGGVPELLSVLYGDRSYEMVVTSDRFSYTVAMRGSQFQVQVQDERARRLDRGRKMAALPDGDLPVLAPITGLVVKVLVAEGDMVEENQPMVLLEAMKMENELRAQKAGKVKQVRIVAGQRVEQNALLLLLE